MDELRDEELELYSRQIVLQKIGYEGQVKLRNGRVCVAGMGGLGSAAAPLLAAMGVGHLRIVDHDVVEISNLPRQRLYDRSSLGYAKVEAAADFLSRSYPDTELEPRPISIRSETARDVVRGMDVVVDGLDSMAPRYALNRACLELGVTYVFAAAITILGNISTIVPGRTPCLECFYGNLDDAKLPSCGTVGVHPSILSIVASVEVSEATDVLTGRGPRLAGKMLYCDLEDMTFERIEISRSEKCPACGAYPSAPSESEGQGTVLETCGRGGRRVFIVTPRHDLGLDLRDVMTRLKEMGFRTLTKGSLGVTFEGGPKVSVLRSGVMIIEGLEDRGSAELLFSRVVGLGIDVTPAGTSEGSIYQE